MKRPRTLATPGTAKRCTRKHVVPQRGSCQQTTPSHHDWWRIEAARAGTDWRGPALFQAAVFPAAIKRVRRAAAVTDEYHGLSSTFVDACRRADEEFRERHERLAGRPVRDTPRLAASTIAAVDYLLKQDDPQRLRSFIAEHPAFQAREIIAYAKERKSCR